MFDFVRKHTKIMQFVLFLLIFPSFVLFGIDGYNRFRDQGAPAAQVDGQTIGQADWDAAHKSETERVRASMPSLDPKLLDSPEAKYATLERLMRERVLDVAANKLNISTSDQRLARDLSENQSIAALRKPDGSLDMERYKQLVGSQGLTPEMFEARVRQDLSVRQVLAGVTNSGLAGNALADASLNAYFERREVQVLRLLTPQFASKLTPSDAELEQFYKDNPAMFQAPEQANIEYLVLDQEAIRKTIVLTSEELKAYYDQNQQRLAGTEERRASHILIASPKSAPESERQAAKAKAESILQAVKKSPESFADSARKNSQDPGSAPNGGDLDFFARGSMVKPFEDTVFAQKKGDISDVVETEFGYHIIRLTDIKSAKQRTFEELKPEIENDLKKQQSQKKFAETAEAFTNSVYEQSDTFKGVAERFKLEIKTATGVTRKAKPGERGPLSNTKFLNAVFSSDSVDKKRNTEAVEVGSNQLVSGRIVQYTAARTMPFAEIKDRVRERAVATKGAQLAKKEGTEKLAALKLDANAVPMVESLVVARGQSQNVPPQVVDAALRVDATKLPGFAGVDLGAAGYVVLRVNKVLASDAVTVVDGKEVRGVTPDDRKQYVQAWSNAESVAYYNMLKERYKAEIKAPKPAKKAADAEEAL